MVQSVGSLEEPKTETNSSVPLGIQFIRYRKNSVISYKFYQVIVLAVTFFAYACYHVTRKTASIVKTALDPGTPNLSSGLGSSFFLLARKPFFRPSELKLVPSSAEEKGWAPFNGPDGTSLLGEIDLAFLAVYSVGMFFAGHLGDRLDLRIFLTLGMVGTGVLSVLFGFGYWFNIHSFYYFLIIQLFAGLFQSTGWPSVVAVIGNWFGKKNRGLIMGIWNAHTSVGNISGSLIASALLKYGWGWSFTVPGLLMCFAGLVVFLLLPVSPASVGAYEKDDDDLKPDKVTTEVGIREPLLENNNVAAKDKAVGFMEAWKIPGVAPYALCLFFSKLVAYTFLYWLPFYISRTEINGQYLSDETAGNLSTMFDVGGVIGEILAGHISDRLNARAITAASFTYCAIPALYLYRSYGHSSLYMNVGLMFITGMFVNGPYALITTAVSTDLGTHNSLNGNSRALATVTAIIDGTGSVGAALGPLLTGYISARSWNSVFTMLMTAALVAGLLLTRLVIAEVAEKIHVSRSRSQSPIAPSRSPVTTLV